MGYFFSVCVSVWSIHTKNTALSYINKSLNEHKIIFFYRTNAIYVSTNVKQMWKLNNEEAAVPGGGGGLEYKKGRGARRLA